MISQQKRGQPRIDFRVAVQVGAASRLQQFYSRNLSSGGIFLEVEGKPPKIGAKLKLAFEVPMLAKAINVEAEVAHHHIYEMMDEKMKKEKKTGIGLKFLNLSDHDQALINQYVTGKDLRVSN